MTFQLYEVSYNTNDIRGNIRLLKAEITREKEKINMLRVELSAAKRPENLQRLSDNLLQLKPQKVDQFITIAQMPEQYAKALPEVDSGIDSLLAADLIINDPIADLIAQ